MTCKHKNRSAGCHTCVVYLSCLLQAMAHRPTSLVILVRVCVRVRSWCVCERENEGPVCLLALKMCNLISKIFRTLPLYLLHAIPNYFFPTPDVACGTFADIWSNFNPLYHALNSIFFSQKLLELLCLWLLEIQWGSNWWSPDYWTFISLIIDMPSWPEQQP